MAVNYSTSVKNNRMTQVVNAIDGGSGNGVLEIRTAGGSTLLASITLAKPCATVASGVLTLAGTPLSATAAASGTAAMARIKDSAGTLIVDNLTVGIAASDIVINTTSVSASQTVSLASGTLTHAA